MPPLNILWVNTELPHPDRFALLRDVNREHPITFLTFEDAQMHRELASRAAACYSALVTLPKPIAPTHRIAAVRDVARHMRSPLPYAVWRWRSDGMRRKIEEIVHDDSIDVVITDSLAASVNIPEGLPVPLILLERRIEAISWYQRTVNARDVLHKLYYQRQWYRMYAFERRQCHRFDRVIAVAPEDLAWITVEYGVRRAALMPGSVDTECFQPSAETPTENGHVVVVAWADASPNEDDAFYFVADVLPHVPDSLAPLRVTIVCRQWTPRLQALSRLDPRVNISVESDVRSSLRRAAAVVVPRRIGGGPRSEILQALAMEKSVVATTVGIEGLPVRDGEHLLIADTPEQFAAALVRVLGDPVLAGSLASRGATLMRSELSSSHAAAWLAATCQSISGTCIDAGAVSA